MSEWVNVILRFALYTDLMLLFGLALFGLSCLRGQERRSGAALPFCPLLTATALVGLLLSFASLVLMTIAMSGVSDLAQLRPHFEMILLETDVGLAWAVRIGALTIAGLALMIYSRAPGISLLIIVLTGALALGSLAWNGHGAMDEGSRRLWHFVTDILHLLAAGGWFGALVAFALMASTGNWHTEARIRLLAAAVSRFERAGALIVGLITVTGVANYLFIVGPKVDVLPFSAYGILMLSKVGLFAGMLVLAALNRFHLGPFLQRSLHDGQYRLAANALRRSVWVELAAAVLIVGLVAWLGTLSPEMETGNL
jgi:putative copper resistance protein D